MTNTPRRGLIVGAASALLLMSFGLAIAQSTKFYKKHRGQLFVSTEAFEASDDDAASDAVQFRHRTARHGCRVGLDPRITRGR